MSHSPFPWSRHRQAPACVYDADGKRISSPSINVDPETAADNAALIAAIPRLISALEFVRDGYARNDVNHVDYRVQVYGVALDVLASIGKTP